MGQEDVPVYGPGSGGYAGDGAGSPGTTDVTGPRRRGRKTPRMTGRGPGDGDASAGPGRFRGMRRGMVVAALSGTDYRNILETVEAVYSAQDMATTFQAFCLRLQKFVGFYSAIFVPTDLRTGAELFSGYQIFNNAEEPMLAYLAHYASQDPFVTSGWFRNGVNEMARNTDLLPALRNTEFACDFLVPLASVYYVIASPLRAQGDSIGFVGIHRQKHDRNFTDRETAVVNQLLPHLARSIHVRELLKGEAAFTETWGVVHVDRAGVPCFMNSLARSLLGDIRVTRLVQPDGGANPVFLRSGSRRYRVRTVPLRGASGGRFVILDPPPSWRGVAAPLRGFGLSRRETEVAALVIDGLSNRQIAEQLFISELTVKDHLKRIFGKTGVRRRSALAGRMQRLHVAAGQGELETD